MDENNKQFELEKQLHQQYAINNNESIKSFVSFIGALLTLLGGFGYVLVHSKNRFTENLAIKGDIISTEVFFLCAFVVSGMLFFLSLVSLQLGYSNRNNQINFWKVLSIFW